MAVSDVSNDILQAFFSQYTLVDGEVSAVVPIMKLSDANKVASITSYLQGRITANQNKINALPQYVIDQTAALNADIAACNDAITNLGK